MFNSFNSNLVIKVTEIKPGEHGYNSYVKV